MIDTEFLVLQNLTDSEREQNLCSEILPSASQGAHQATSIKAELLSDAEAEEDPLAITFAGGIKAEPEVSCVSMSLLGQFQ
jgi:hypothetical protein